jgi:predicted DNA-binding protein (UPF0251 family)
MAFSFVVVSIVLLADAGAVHHHGRNDSPPLHEYTDGMNLLTLRTEQSAEDMQDPFLLASTAELAEWQLELDAHIKKHNSRHITTSMSAEVWPAANLSSPYVDTEEEFLMTANTELTELKVTLDTYMKKKEARKQSRAKVYKALVEDVTELSHNAFTSETELGDMKHELNAHMEKHKARALRVNAHLERHQALMEEVTPPSQRSLLMANEVADMDLKLNARRAKKQARRLRLDAHLKRHKVLMEEVGVNHMKTVFHAKKSSSHQQMAATELEPAATLPMSALAAREAFVLATAAELAEMQRQLDEHIEKGLTRSFRHAEETENAEHHTSGVDAMHSGAGKKVAGATIPEQAGHALVALAGSKQAEHGESRDVADAETEPPAYFSPSTQVSEETQALTKQNELVAMKLKMYTQMEQNRARTRRELQERKYAEQIEALKPSAAVSENTTIAFRQSDFAYVNGTVQSINDSSSQPMFTRRRMDELCERMNADAAECRRLRGLKRKENRQQVKEQALRRAGLAHLDMGTEDPRHSINNSELDLRVELGSDRMKSQSRYFLQRKQQCSGHDGPSLVTAFLTYWEAGIEWALSFHSPREPRFVAPASAVLVYWLCRLKR